MSLDDELFAVFGQLPPPTNLVGKHNIAPNDWLDIGAFEGRNWWDLCAEDWNSNMDAIFEFSPEAFVYYLPSLVHLSIINPTSNITSVGALLLFLDTYAPSQYRNEFFNDRLSRLSNEQVAIIKKWVIHLLEYPQFFKKEVLERIFDSL